MKTCISCSRDLPLEEFYPHRHMADGRLNKCKACVREAVKVNRRSKRAYYREYERERFQRAERRTAVLGYQREQRARNPEKYLARQAVARALKSGALTRKPCEVAGCGSMAQAHHRDYSKPLEVRWLCFVHHRMEHGQLLDLVADAALGLSP